MANVCDRRQWLRRAGLVAAYGAAGGGFARGMDEAATQSDNKSAQSLELKDFQPRSMLHIKETKVLRSRFPVIDIHTHLGWSKTWEKGVPMSEEMTFFAPAETLIPVMDRKNVSVMVNLTGGHGRGVAESVAQFERKYPGRFMTFTELSYSRAAEPNYSSFQAEEIGRARRAGARGLKVLKTLGLYLREHITSGSLVKVDDKRFDATWDTCGALNMPVAIHVGDPEAFFLPIDRFNERFEELNNHPDWSFYGRDFPRFSELMEALYRVVGRHPRTKFIALHVGCDAENLGYVSDQLDRHKNLCVELAARIGELGRQPRTARRFVDRHQDRILFGTDAVPTGLDMPQQLFCDQLYEIYYRFLETEDDYFDYAPANVPPQGRWRIGGIGLSEQVLRKVYHDNAARLLGMSA
jgi:predicted TIM-barrel fold metal-dependent hydrolase